MHDWRGIRIDNIDIVFPIPFISVNRAQKFNIAPRSVKIIIRCDLAREILCIQIIEQRLFGKGKDKQAEIQYSCGFVAGWLPKS